MEGLISDYLFTFPMVLDSPELQSVNLTNSNGLQLEVKDQSVPLVIFENGDFILQNITGLIFIICLLRFVYFSITWTTTTIFKCYVLECPLLLSNTLTNGNIAPVGE